ncbi:uncharacterized protein DDB_G0287625-like [Anopheles ziemanni]|uniref:uncharacterized protein DDB_G0287625-like n=1 Tax=Anopheles coustani TaxID=139045 RepID=UPI002658C969|nr:uncharacterized protein DDB_G0287625-like [Anopheles coustani]XP_058119572.1 uncharacterized protein DDB_G0287625-like [Anopheles coustani]XP_058172076.1 uncharacterized protein DDB_G0287625-like [Anopheles ziemanni]
MMNNGISKIHFINSTGMSLNDRFTAFSKGPAMGMTVSGLERPPRTRSNSVSRMDSNRLLVERWDRSNAMQSAMQLKNTAIRRPARQRLQRNTMALQFKRSIDKLEGGLQRFQRSNSFNNIATMNADRIQLQRTRGMTPSIASRLGGGGQTRRGRSVSRGRSASRTRSTSRGRQPSLGRTNSQLDLRRAGSRERLPRATTPRTNLTRAGSRNRLNVATLLRKAVAPNDARRRLLRKTAVQAVKATNNGAANRSRSRSRSRSRVRAAAAIANTNANNNNNNNVGRARSRKRASSRGRNVRSGSVNSRLGTNRTNELAATAVASARGGGRVSKRSQSRRRRGVKKAATTAVAAVGTRVGRPLKRETGRKGAGGKAQQQQANGNKAANGASRRGRSRSRRANSRVRGRSASKNRTPLAKKEPKSREELDSELDQYMANTRTLDKEMEEYINGTGTSRI